MLSPLSAQWLSAVAPLLKAPEVRSMSRWHHHFSVTCWQHSLLVSYLAFRLARRFGWDGAAAARAGLLHDLYLYDPASLPARVQCRVHPRAALRNARLLCPDLTPEEADAILSHMWPLSRRRPHCRTALAVSLADKLSSAAEAACLFRPDRIRRLLPAPLPA